MSNLWHWFRSDKVAYDIPYQIERFQQKFGRSPTILLSRDGQPAPEGFGLAAKKDMRILPGELYLE